MQPESPQSLRALLSKGWQLIKDNWLISTGTLFILCAIAWFLRYAISLEWFSPENSVYLLCGISALVYIAGLGITHRQQRLGLNLIGLGTLGVFFALSAGMFLVHPLWNPLVAASILIGIFAVTGLIALYYDAKDLITLVFVGVLSMPYSLTIAYIWEPATLLTYFLFFALLASVFKQWKDWGMPFFLSCISAINAVNIVYGEASNTQIGLYLFLCQLLFVSPALLRFCRPGPPLNQTEFLSYVIASIVPFFWWGDILQSKLWTGILLSGCVLLIIVVGYFASKRHSVETLKGAGRAMAILLSIEALIASLWVFDLLDFRPFGSYTLGDNIAWFTISLAAVVVAHFAYQSPRLARWFAFFYVLAMVRLLLDHSGDIYSSNWNDPLYWCRIIAFVSTAIGATIVWYGWKGDPNSSKNDLRPHFLVAAAVTLGAIVLWNTWDVLIQPQAVVRAITLVCTSAAGLILFIIGNRRMSPFWKNAGLFLLAFVALRLLTVEMWLMDIGPRILAFLCIGVLFLVAAFITQRKKQ